MAEFDWKGTYYYKDHDFDVMRQFRAGVWFSCNHATKGEWIEDPDAGNLLWGEDMEFDDISESVANETQARLRALYAKKPDKA